MKKLNKKNKGFTLIEILVAATIIAVLAAIAITSYGSANKSSRDARRKADLENVRTALELYKSQLGYYPPAGGVWVNLTSLNADLVTGGYIATIPADPKSDTVTPYRYKATDLSGVNYYGYCLESAFEVAAASYACTAEATYTYSIKNP